mgnify:CR=1 FL=1|tara:strand:- start:847 stop:1674 length:828 start_codon:yes stop_codon:yes gene_type:complete
MRRQFRNNPSSARGRGRPTPPMRGFRGTSFREAQGRGTFGGRGRSSAPPGSRAALRAASLRQRQTGPQSRRPQSGRPRPGAPATPPPPGTVRPPARPPARPPKRKRVSFKGFKFDIDAAKKKIAADPARKARLEAIAKRRKARLARTPKPSQQDTAAKQARKVGGRRRIETTRKVPRTVRYAKAAEVKKDRKKFAQNIAKGLSATGKKIDPKVAASMKKLDQKLKARKARFDKMTPAQRRAAQSKMKGYTPPKKGTSRRSRILAMLRKRRARRGR